MLSKLSWADQADEPTSPIKPHRQGASVSEPIDPSVTRPNDKYDHLGRNVSAQIRRQSLVPWTTVDYTRHRIPKDAEFDC
tara:strand:+ start:717 stop:956 length:240 start_codon:yes stop_codon:yes gene_type:complete